LIVSLAVVTWVAIVVYSDKVHSTQPGMSYVQVAAFPCDKQKP